jgi:hypothetical protein
MCALELNNPELLELNFAIKNKTSLFAQSK